MSEHMSQAELQNDGGLDEYSVEKARNPKLTTKRLLRYLFKQKAKFIVILLSLIISCGLMIAAPLVVGQAIDILFKGIQSNTPFSALAGDIGRILTVLGLLYLFSSVFSYIAQYFMAGVSQTLTLTLRQEISLKLSRLPLHYYDSHQKGDILSRATNDLERVGDSLQEGLMQLINAVITIVAAVVIMMTISPTLTLIIIAVLSASLFVTGKLSPKIEKRYADNQQTLGSLNGVIEETFTGMALVKAFNREEASMAAFREINGQLVKTNWRAQFSVYAVSPFVKILGKTGYVAVAVIGGVFAVNGTLSLGRIQAFIQYVDMCLEPAHEAAYVMSMMQSAVASAERVFDLLDAPEEVPDTAGNSMIVNPKGKVEFQHVSFGYQEGSLLMKDIHLSLNAGDTVAIVGPTGAGKTTLINLLMRFYELQGGRITVDGYDISRLNRGHLRRMFGMVLQDTWLFHGTVLDNIAYGDPNATQEEIMEAAKAARVHHFIQTLPQGYRTMLDEDGSNLSQGQRQLLTIARAILAKPAILILDEATSSVDTRTEAEIQKAMKRLMQGRTSFVIAHRLSTIRDADRILVMKDGTIIEQGSHHELMSQKGFYEELYNSQFAAKASDQ